MHQNVTKFLLNFHNFRDLNAAFKPPTHFRCQRKWVSWFWQTFAKRSTPTLLHACDETKITKVHTLSNGKPGTNTFVWAKQTRTKYYDGILKNVKITHAISLLWDVFEVRCNHLTQGLLPMMQVCQHCQFVIKCVPYMYSLHKDAFW